MKPQSKWNVASLFAPIIGIVAATPFYLMWGPLFGLITGIYICGFFLMLGVVFALIAIVKREGSLLFTLIVLLLNSLPLIWFLLNRNTRLYGP
ncbi:MAG: hypothetical protein ACLQUR_04595 [Limisphaerales bacterium]